MTSQAPYTIHDARSILKEQGYTCVLCRESTVYTSRLRGVKPLAQWLQSGTDLRGFSAADKVVGRATAFLYVLLGVKEVHAAVMSRAAREVLEDQGITASWDTLTDHIINRAGDGICPFEEAVLEITDPHAALIAIHEKMRQMQISL